MHLLSIQNDPIEPLGLIGEYLGEHGHTWDTLTTYNGYDTNSIDKGKYDALIVMGGRFDSWEEKYTPLHRFIRSWIESGKGYMGVCLGAQLLSIAMDGKVELGQYPEIGHMEVNLRKKNNKEKILDGLEPTIPVFQWHQDCIIVLPDKAENLLSSEITQNQFIKINDKVYGMQFHWDIDDVILADLVAEHGQWLALKNANPAKLVKGMQNNRQTYKKALYVLLDNWFDLLKE